MKYATLSRHDVDKLFTGRIVRLSGILPYSEALKGYLCIVERISYVSPAARDFCGFTAIIRPIKPGMRVTEVWIEELILVCGRKSHE